MMSVFDRADAPDDLIAVVPAWYTIGVSLCRSREEKVGAAVQRRERSANRAFLPGTSRS
jgi:hypothetical protein